MSSVAPTHTVGSITTIAAILAAAGRAASSTVTGRANIATRDGLRRLGVAAVQERMGLECHHSKNESLSDLHFRCEWNGNVKG